ncbi:MAG: TonB-dependent receptor [Candidatus Aminicenantes bacterium]|nr:TonB-dependent receptor [Candidatus Aminicenantes bacterium]
MRNKLLCILAITLLLAPIAFSQSKETGAIRGVVTDEQGAPLPGVNVTISSQNLMGIRTFLTDAGGEFRFPALPPGEYQVKAELQGFGAVIREKIRVNTTSTLNIDIQMKASTISEEVTVTAQSPTIDVKSTETASVTLSNEILRNVPNSQFTSDIVNLAPGVKDDVAYGASQSTGIAYSMDGVNVADPEAGSAWVFSDYNIIEEAKVMGVGLPAEYGNFTGVIFNLVTKSGGNNFSGHFEFDFQGYQADSKFWQANNNQAYLTDFPSLTSPSSKLMDINGHLGGPIVKDKLWFYVGGQFYRTRNRPAGFPEDVDYKQPRFFAKLTSQLTSTLSMNLAFQRTKYQGTNRGADATTLPIATVTQDSPDWLLSFSLTKILSPKTFFDIKANYFEGRYYLDPTAGYDTYSHFNLDANMLTDSAGYYYYADRARFGTNASLTHYAEDFLLGSHEFKFGAEFERSMARSRYGYTGTGGTLGDNVKYVDYYSYGYSGPYLAYQYGGYDTNTRYTRLEMFFQDSWQVTKRLNLSLGLRYSQNWGDVKGVSGTVFKTKRLAPRLGFTFDILGDKSTILKAHYGHFTEAMLTAYHDRMNPSANFKDYVGYYWDLEAGEWAEMFRTPYTPYTMDPNIKHPYMAQFTVGIERELFKDTSFGVTYINRKWNDLIGRYNRAADYTEQSVYSSDLDQTFTVYEQTAETLGATDYLITNLRKDPVLFPWILEEPYRKYEGIEVLFNKRFSNRWQLLVSYVYGKATGTINNSFGGDIGWGGAKSDPNAWINAKGNLTYDPTHMIKLQGTYVLPFDISLTGYFWGITGESWTTRFRTSSFNQGRITFFTEPRGSNHYPMEKILNLRLEKIFTLADKYRLGLMVDVFNVFNANTINSWGTRIGYDWTPGDYTSTDGHELYGISTPRQARIGARLMF